MNLCLSMAFRPSSLVILLSFGSLLVLGSLTACWYITVAQIEERENFLKSEIFFSQLQSEIEYSAELMKSSSSHLSRFLSSALNASNVSFSDIKTKVAPLLFQAFETVPHLDQISYRGMQGLFFSYCRDHDQALTIYSNSSSSLRRGASNTTQYYIQRVNQDTGEVYGEATSYNPSINTSCILEAVNVSYGYASLGTKWGNDHDPLFLSSARVTRTAVITIGFSATAITDFVTRSARQGTSFYLATKDGKVIVEGILHTRLVISDDKVSLQSLDENGNTSSNEGTVSCKDEAVGSSLNIQDTEYLIHCHPIDIMGIESVYVLAVPRNELVSFDHSYEEKGLTLLIVMIVMLFIAVLCFLFINARDAMREMHLRASLIKQKEATQQAERKNMNKSLAFSTANHDVRASLAGLTGLIDMSYELVEPGSELETNLKQMKGCTQDLLGLLNSILDTSKIEAGKMQLEEEEFDLSLLLEDVVDLYHPVALKKGVDLVLDPCNGSIIRYSRVTGDRGRLKQVLCNLLSNAVKFTDEGHIVVRARAQKPSLHNSIMATKQHSLTKRLSCLFFKKRKKARDDIEGMNSIQQDLHSMDFVFEVDDTGRGIPKENYKSVFENFVQVKETALGVGGTGLGLGIVQSLVRLMHGDIDILDKDIGEKGTCFRFNVLLTVCETVTDGSTREVGEYGSSDRNQTRGPLPTLQTCSSGSSVCSLSPRLRICSSSPRPEASRVVILIADQYRRRTTQKFIESLGIKVIVVKQWEHLFHALKKIKQKGLHSSSQSSQGSEYLSSRSASRNSLARARGVPLSSTDGTESIPSVFKKTDIGAAPGFILIVIDANAGPFSELCEIVSNFNRGLCNPCQVVWLDKPLFKTLDRDMLDPNDIVISKPFHGSRLFQVIKLLPEYGGAWQCSSNKSNGENTHDRGGNTSRDSSLSKYHSYLLERSLASQTDITPCQIVEQILKETQQSVVDQCCARSKERKCENNHGEIQECGDLSYNMPLSGKKILVVEDTALLRKLALATLIPLGASIEQCQNGEEAVQLVGDGLIRDFPNPPYDYILMDCQMPVMDGFEATRRIRKMEKGYDVRIPIIALTAHTDKMTIDAGMDFHLDKPIKREHLLEAIRNIHGKE